MTAPDARTPVTVMLDPVTEARLELALSQIRTAFPQADENMVMDRLFRIGLTVSEALIEAAPGLIREELFDAPTSL